MRKSLYVLGLVVVLSAVLAVAQDAAPQKQDEPMAPSAPAQAGAPAQEQPAAPAAADQSGKKEDVKTKIQDAFKADSNLAGVSVNVTDSKVELSGSVSSQADKDKAESLAKANAGDLAIDNKIEVKSEVKSEEMPKQ